MLGMVHYSFSGADQMLVFLALLGVCYLAKGVRVTIEKWDQEWSTGKWEYLESVATERSRVGAYAP